MKIDPQIGEIYTFINWCTSTFNLLKSLDSNMFYKLANPIIAEVELKDRILIQVRSLDGNLVFKAPVELFDDAHCHLATDGELFQRSLSE